MKKTFLLPYIAVTALVSLLLTGCQSTPSVQPPTEKPETVIQDGLSELSKVKAYNFDFNMGVEAKDPTSPLAQLALKIGGFVDMKDVKNPKLAFKIEATGSDTSGTNGAALMDLQLNKDIFFFNVGKVDVGTPVPPQFAEMIGKWWKITLPEEALKEMHKVLDQAEASQNTAEQEKMKKLLEENNFFGQPTFVAAEDVKGESSNKYSVTIDKKILVQFVTKLNQTQTTSTLSASDIKDFEKGLTMMDITGNVWVGSKSHVLNKMALNLKVNDTVKNTSGTITMDAVFWDFGKDFTVEPHADAQEFPIEQVLMPLLMGGGLPL